MISDSVTFELEPGYTIVVLNSGVVELRGEKTVDISQSSLGGLLKSVLLETSPKSPNPLRGSSNDLTLRYPNVKRGNVTGDPSLTLLTQEAKQTLLNSEIKPDLVKYLGTLNGCASALNNSTNPVKAALTMIAKPSFDQRFQAWLKRQTPVPPPPAEGQIEDEVDMLPKSKAFELED